MNRPAVALIGLLAASLACQSVAAPEAPTRTPAPRPTVTLAAVTSATTAPPATAAASDEGAGLSRAAPSPAGRPAHWPGWTVEVLEVLRGDEAWRRLHDANQFNDPPPAGQAYLLVNLRLTNTDSVTRPINSSDFKLTGDRLIRYFPGSAVPPAPALEGELAGGASASGWVVYQTAAGEGQLMLVLDPLDGADGEPVRYLALDPGASLVVDPTLDSLAPTDLGVDPAEPAPLRRVATAEDWEVAVLDVVRGDDAWAKVLEANQFNDPPPDGLEYVVAQVRVRLISIVDEPVWVTSFYFTTLSGAGLALETPSIVDPEPALEAVLYPGGDFTGWVTVQAPAGDTGARLVFQPWLGGDAVNTRYFTLNP